jgi:pyruvate carboxylase subunit B
MGGGGVTYDLAVEGKELRVVVSPEGDLSIGGKRIHAELLPGGAGIYRLKVGAEHYRIYMKKVGTHGYDVWIRTSVIHVDLSDERDRILTRYSAESGASEKSTIVRAPMPGIVSSIMAQPGEKVEKGVPLLILEAMKMENEIRSPLSGTIAAVAVQVRSTVDKDQHLVTIHPV